MRCAVGGDVTEPADEYAARQSCHLSRLMLLRAARRTGVEVARCGTERKFFNDFSRACACGCAQGRVRSESRRCPRFVRLRRGSSTVTGLVAEILQ